MSSKYVSGDDELIRKLRSIKSKVGNGMSQVALSGAFVLEGFVKQSMQEGHHGRVYRRGGKAHQASAPGEPPAVDYGHLLNSIGSSVIDDEAAQVATNSEAAVHLEFGTARMAARPFMRPAVDEHRKEVANAMVKTAMRLVEEASQ